MECPELLAVFCSFVRHIGRMWCGEEPALSPSAELRVKSEGSGVGKRKAVSTAGSRSGLINIIRRWGCKRRRECSGGSVACVGLSLFMDLLSRLDELWHGACVAP